MPDEHTPYPHPDEFAIMRPQYYEQDDGFWQAVIEVSPYKSSGQSRTKAGARRSALLEAQKTYKSHHSDYTIPDHYPDSFTDREGMEWERTPSIQRGQKGDYTFTDEEGVDDYVDLETMLLWDVRPADTVEDEGGEEDEEEFDLPGL